MTSQNGWDLVTADQLDRSPIPGTNIVPVPGILKGDVATMLHWVGVQFNARVQALYNPGCWGWNAPTPIPGTNIYSNHCSGTAIDFNAPSFPWKLYTMTSAQRKTCREIVAQTEGVVVWGGDYSTFVDEMHFEIDATNEEVARIANKLKGEEDMPNSGDAVNYIRGVKGDPTYNPTQAEIDQAMKTSYKDWSYILGFPNSGDATNFIKSEKGQGYNPTQAEVTKAMSPSFKSYSYKYAGVAQKSEYTPINQTVYVKK